MSYSFDVKAASKAEALELVTQKLAEVAASQRVHAADVHQATAAARAFVDLLAEPPAGMTDICVRVSGSLGWRDGLDTDAARKISATNISVTACHMARPLPA
jgi:hypothetical protein